MDLVGLRSFLSFLKGRGRGGGPGCLCIGIWNWIGFYRAEFVLGLSALWTQVDYETLLYIVVKEFAFPFRSDFANSKSTLWQSCGTSRSEHGVPTWASDPVRYK